MSKRHVKNCYKNLLRVCKALPPSERDKTLSQIRTAFKTNSAETDPNVVKDLLSKAASSLSYLKIITPKSSRRYRTDDSEGVTKMVFPSSSTSSFQQVGAGKKTISNWHGKNLDPDSVKRHYQGLKRAGFKSNADVKGPLF